MSKLWRVEFRKHAWAFSLAASISGALGVGWLIWPQSVLELGFALVNMIAWVALAAYSFYVLYAYYFLGRDTLLHIADFSERQIMVRKAVVLGAYMYGYFLLLLVFNIAHLKSGTYHSLSAVLFYYLLAKAVSIAGFLAICCLLVWFAKFVHQKIIAFALTLVLYTLLTIAQGLLVWHIIAGPGFIWALGISNEFNVVNQYLNIFPIMVGPNSPVFLDDSISAAAVGLNAAVFAIALGLWSHFAERTRFDFYKR